MKKLLFAIIITMLSLGAFATAKKFDDRYGQGGEQCKASLKAQKTLKSEFKQQVVQPQMPAVITKPAAIKQR